MQPQEQRFTYRVNSPTEKSHGWQCVKVTNLTSNLGNEMPFCTQKTGASNNKWWRACEESEGIEAGVLTDTTDTEGIWEYILNIPTQYSTILLLTLHKRNSYAHKKAWKRYHTSNVYGNENLATT